MTSLSNILSMKGATQTETDSFLFLLLLVFSYCYVYGPVISLLIEGIVLFLKLCL